MMLMLRVLAWVPVCLAASACMSALSVWGWPLEPDLLAASGWCAHRFHGRKKERGREWETLVSERCCAPACMGVNVCCMFNEANWSRVSRMHTRLMAWLQPCDTKQSALVCLCVCAGTMSMCGNDASVTQLLLSNMCVWLCMQVWLCVMSSRTRRLSSSLLANIFLLIFFLSYHLSAVNEKH